MQVPLGIYLKGEQKLEEMIEVLTHLHQYIPTVTEEVSAQVNEEPVKVTTNSFYSTLVDKREYELMSLKVVTK